MRRWLPFVIVGFVGVVTLSSATVFYRSKKAAAAAQVALTKEAGKAGEGHTLGPKDAPVVLEEYGDFECPPCGTLSMPLDKMVEEFAPNVRLVFRHFPLPMHAHAHQAAIAAEAAAEQGKFWEMHDLIYKEQLIWSKNPNPLALFESYAGILGLNVERFKRDMLEHETAEKVNKDREGGVKLGVKNTPTVFLDGKEVPPPSLNPPVLRGLVEEAVKGKKDAPATN